MCVYVIMTFIITTPPDYLIPNEVKRKAIESFNEALQKGPINIRDSYVTWTDTYSVEQLEKDEAELLKLQQAIFNNRPMGREKRIHMIKMRARAHELEKICKKWRSAQNQGSNFQMKSIKKKL